MVVVGDAVVVTMVGVPVGAELVGANDGVLEGGKLGAAGGGTGVVGPTVGIAVGGLVDGAHVPLM